MGDSKSAKSVKPVLDDPRFRIRPIQQVASACTGGLITACFMTPLDVVKTRLQAQQSALASNKCFLYCNGLMDHLCPCEPNTAIKAEKHLNGTIDAFVKITRNEGVSALWSGLSPTLVSALPSTVVYFVAYEQFKARFLNFHYTYISATKGSSRGRDIPYLVPMLSGVSARICAVTFVSPIELVRTRMQYQKMSFDDVVSTTRAVLKTQGVRGLFRGLPHTILRDVPFSGMYWTCYEFIKSSYDVVEPTFGFSFMAGAISGSIAATVTTPFDVVKTHEQIEFGEKELFTDKPAHTTEGQTIYQRLWRIYRASGIRGLFSGLGPRLLKVAPACAIMISTFEYSKSFFYHYNVDRYHEDIVISQHRIAEEHEPKK